MPWTAATNYQTTYIHGKHLTKSPRMIIRAAIVQHPPIFFNLAASVELAAGYIRRASAGNAALVVFPESWLPGYPVWLDEAPGAGLWNYQPPKTLYRLIRENALTPDGQEFKLLQKAAAKHKIDVVIGAQERVGHSLYNSMYFLSGDGKTSHIHRKLMPTYTERLLWARGDGSTLQTLSTEYGNIGGLICWEHWMPLARAAMHARKESIHIAQWPMVKEMNLIASRHYAFEGQCFVLAAGCVSAKSDIVDGLASMPGDHQEARDFLNSMPGDEDSLLQRGGSAIIGPDGSFITEPLYNKKDIIFADLDLRLLAEGQMYLDSDGHYSRPDIFQLRVDNRVQKNVNFEDQE